ncbi:glycosyltransferase [Candidatus Gottesmanbacteria bacterium]|nr:glycosyltransferase [Candidatus Gottesmanbacteria bacterium]
MDTNLFKGAKYSNKADYFLIVSRLVSYKGINLAIEAFNTLGWPLIIIGSGREKKDLQNIAKSNITFITPHLTDSDLLTYYQNCRALIFPGSEDLGLTPIEAQAVGKPVIALRSGGTLETIKEGISGEFFDHPNIESLIQTLRLFDKKDYNSINIRKGVLKFDKEIFKKAFKNIVYTQLAKLD